MELPTRAEILAVSPLLTESWPEVATTPPDLLDTVIPIASALVAEITGRAIGEFPGTAVPAGMEGLATTAVAMKAAQLTVSMTPEVAAELAEGSKRLKGFSAGPYSESYFAPGDLVVKGGIPQVDPDARLAELLWALMTPEKREEWLDLLRGEVAPYSQISSLVPPRGHGGTRVGIGPDGF
jgi:hypothetical protein